MTRTSSFLALAAAVLVLAGCGGGEKGSLASPSATAAALEAADGTDYEACFDVDCEVVVTAGTTFAVDSTYGIDTMTVASIEDGTVKVEGEGAGTHVSGSFGTEGATVLNGILIQAAAIEEAEAVLVFSPHRR